MSLPELIIENWGAVEADLSTYHQVTDPLSLSWRRLSTLVRNLPAAGAFIRAVAATFPTPAKERSEAPSEPPTAGEVPEWLVEYNRKHDIKAEYQTLDILRDGVLPDGERRVS